MATPLPAVASPLSDVERLRSPRLAVCFPRLVEEQPANLPPTYPLHPQTPPAASVEVVDVTPLTKPTHPLPRRMVGRMLKSATVPLAECVKLTEYERLYEYAERCAAGALNLVVVVSDPGLGKTTTFTAAYDKKFRKEDYLILRRLTAFKCYQRIHDFGIDKHLLFDDNDDYFNDPSSSPQLKQLCDTVEIKTLEWESAPMQKAGYPVSFKTKSPVVVLTNSIKKIPEAVRDRGLVLHFTPSVFSVHEEVRRRGFCHPEVFSFMEEHLHLITRPSMRTYFTGTKLLKAGIAGWRNDLRSTFNPDLDQTAVELVAALMSKTDMTSEAKVAEFNRQTHLSRATYMRYQSALMQAQGK